MDLKKICLTPTRNEAWILPIFLKLAEQWADHIIIMDQCSTDDTRKIAAAHPKVRLIENDDPTYDEAFRQKTLIDAAREIAGKRLIFALDADEAFSANWLSSEEWNSVCQSEVGTRFRLHWVSPFADLERCSVTGPKIYGFMDDGSDHEGSQIHSIRVPEKADAPLFQLDEIVLLHFDRLSVRRMAIKRAWYQCWELVNSSGLSTVDIVRGYYERKEFSRKTSEVFQEQWYQAFSQLDIQLDNIDDSESTWWEHDILKLFQQYGAHHFRNITIWDIPWSKIAEGAGLDSRIAQDPRGFHHQLYHSWLTGTQHCRHLIFVRLIDALLRRLFT